MTQDVWVMVHPYLRSLAAFHAEVEKAAAERPISASPAPDFNDYMPDFHTGVPLLLSTSASGILKLAEPALLSSVDCLITKSLPEKLMGECRALAAEMHQDANAPQRAVAWLLGTEEFTPEHPGLLRYLGWIALARYLLPVVVAFGNWRDEERWLRSYCPTCGSMPAMAQLVGDDPGRLRLLSCGCCGTRWRFRRTGCPFCENNDDHRLAVLTVEGEAGLRIDYCQHCDGYLKTYSGKGNDSFLMADWTSLHLDVLARDRGLKRLAASLYKLEL
jgi:FdhE protein